MGGGKGGKGKDKGKNNQGGTSNTAGKAAAEAATAAAKAATAAAQAASAALAGSAHQQHNSKGKGGAKGGKGSQQSNCWDCLNPECPAKGTNGNWMKLTACRVCLLTWAEGRTMGKAVAQQQETIAKTAAEAYKTNTDPAGYQPNKADQKKLKKIENAKKIAAANGMVPGCAPTQPQPQQSSGAAPKTGATVAPWANATTHTSPAPPGPIAVAVANQAAQTATAVLELNGPGSEKPKPLTPTYMRI